MPTLDEIALGNRRREGAAPPKVHHNGGVIDRPLPIGTVTFLFTDLEGSTALWQERADDMARAIPRHYELLDEVIRRHRGARPVEQGEGDSVVAGFASAVDAAAAALDVQRAFQREPWPGGLDLRIRVALHTDEAVLRDPRNYAGNPMIRTARIRAAANGRQILLSDTAARSVRDAIPEGASLVDRGVHRLKGLLVPEQVWELRHPDFAACDRPLATTGSHGHNLPARSSTLVGRDRDLDTVLRHLGAQRVVTLVGAGGVGKTTLAVEAGHVSLGERLGGVWFVELAPVAEGTAVVPAVLAALAIVDDGTRPALDAIVERLSSTPSLLVLDNCEHLRDSVRELVDALVGACAQLTVLATSREPLAAAGETVWRVPALELPPDPGAVTAATAPRYASMVMFTEAARRAQPAFALDDATAPAVADICVRLDGIPLALELAAARCRHMPVGRVASALADRFRLLTVAGSALETRQQTLLASVAWSYDLLDEVEQRVLRRLAVFSGRFPADGAEAVVADAGDVDPWDVAEALGALVDKSLVYFADGTYRLLETVRQFALARTDEAGETVRLRRAHVRWWIDHLTSIDARQPSRESVELCSLHRNDLRAALDSVADDVELRLVLLALVGPNWDFGGHADDLITFADRWVAGGPPDDDLVVEWARCWPSAASVWFRSWRQVDKTLARRAVDVMLRARDARGVLGSYAMFAPFNPYDEDVRRMSAAVALGVETPRLFAVNAPWIVGRLHDVDVSARARWQPHYASMRLQHPFPEFAAPDITNVWPSDQVLARPPRSGDELFLLDRLLNANVSGQQAFLRGDDDALARIEELLGGYEHMAMTSMWRTGMTALRAVLAGRSLNDAQHAAVAWFTIAGSAEPRYLSARILLATGGRHHGDILWRSFDRPGAGTVVRPLLDLVIALHGDDLGAAEQSLAATLAAEEAHPWPAGHHDVLELAAVLALRHGDRDRAAALLEAARPVRARAGHAARWPDQQGWLAALEPPVLEPIGAIAPYLGARSPLDALRKPAT